MASIIQTPPLRLRVEPLTHEAYAPFGTVIENPLGPLAAEGSPLPELPRNAVFANQGTAIKHLDVTKMTDLYALAPSKRPAKAVMNIFSCTARGLRRASSQAHVVAPVSPTQTFLLDQVGKAEYLFDVRILERHPYTSQTFIPLGLDPADTSRSYLVIVAPTDHTSNHSADSRWSLRGIVRGLSGKSGDDQPGGSGPPDVSRMRAFLARGSQAVTYAAGTWHAPMVVLGVRGIDFAVVQFANGVTDEDCQETLLQPEAGQTQGASVIIELPRDSPVQNIASPQKSKM